MLSEIMLDALFPNFMLLFSEFLNRNTQEFCRQSQEPYVGYHSKPFDISLINFPVSH